MLIKINFILIHLPFLCISVEPHTIKSNKLLRNKYSYEKSPVYLRKSMQKSSKGNSTVVESTEPEIKKARFNT